MNRKKKKQNQKRPKNMWLIITKSGVTYELPRKSCNKAFIGENTELSTHEQFNINKKAQGGTQEQWM